MNKKIFILLAPVFFLTGVFSEDKLEALLNNDEIFKKLIIYIKKYKYPDDINYFKELSNQYARIHTDLVFSDDLESPGSGLSSQRGSSLRCVLKKQAQEYQFLMDQKISDSLLKNWLGDAQTIFFDDIKKIAPNDKILVEINTKLKEFDVIQHTISDNESFNFSLGEDVFPIDRGCLFLDEKCETYTAKFGIKKRDKAKNSKDLVINRGFIFSIEDIEIIKVMEGCITEEFIKVIKLQSNRPFVIKKIIEGHSNWMDYREELLSLYIRFNIPPEIIKLRLLCFNLSRIYLYRNYYNFFSAHGEKERCIQSEPIEYNWMYDCSIIRNPLKLPPIPSCFSD